MIRCWLLARYIRWGTKRAELDSRNLAGWCDYRPAHCNVKWVAKVDGRTFGRSCTKHSGALLIDALREGNATLEAIPQEPSRLTPVIVE